jgi:hypothetical protein
MHYAIGIRKVVAGKNFRVQDSFATVIAVLVAQAVWLVCTPVLLFVTGEEANIATPEILIYSAKLTHVPT